MKKKIRVILMVSFCVTLCAALSVWFVLKRPGTPVAVDELATSAAVVASGGAAVQEHQPVGSEALVEPEKQAEAAHQAVSTQGAAHVGPGAVQLGAVQLEDGYVPIQAKKTADDGRLVIPIVTSFPLGGSNVIIGTQMFDALQNYLKELRHTVRDASGKEYKFYFELMGNNPHSGAQGYRTVKDLLKKSPLLMGFMEPELLSRLEAKIKNKKVLVLFPGSGDAEFREKTAYENILYFRPSYDRELEALVQYLVTESDKRNCAIFYEASVWGERLRRAADDVFKKQGIEVVARASYPQDSVEIGDAVKQIVKSVPNVVFLAAKPRAAYFFVKQAVSKGLHNCQFMGLSDLNTIQKLLSETKVSDDVMVTSLVPKSHLSKANNNHDVLPIVQEYNTTMKSFLSFRSSSPFFLEVYVMCELLVACINKIVVDNREVTIKNIITEFNALRQTTYKGFVVDPEKRSIWINPGVKKTWQEVVVKDVAVKTGGQMI